MTKLTHTEHNLVGLGARPASVGLGAKADTSLLPALPYPMRRTLLDGGGLPWTDFAPSALTFTPAMRKAIGTGSAFDRGLLVQGLPDGSGTPDVVSFPRGDLLGNQTQYKYANIDPYQGTIVFSIRPFWAGNDGLRHQILGGSGDTFQLYKSTGNALTLVVGGQTVTGSSTAAWAAGTTYLVAVSWNQRKTIDGTNYVRSYVNGVSTFAGATAPTPSAPGATFAIGSNGTTYPLQAIISGLTVYDRVLTGPGGYGVDVGNTPGSDELTVIYNAGTPLDPVQVTGADNVVACAPTDQQDTALATTLQAWSYPMASAIPNDSLCSFGEVIDSQYGVVFNGTSTYINCGSGATLDDLPTGGHFTVAIWARIEHTGLQVLARKGNYWSPGWFLQWNTPTDIRLFVVLATTSITAQYVAPVSLADGKYHLYVAYYNDTTKRGRVSVDGKWGALSAAGVGAYVSDAAWDLQIGTPSFRIYGSVASVELSDNDRHGGAAGTNFVPPRGLYNDGNTIESWAMDEGTGATVAATVTSPANDGTITSGTWTALAQSYGTPVVPPIVVFDGSTTIINGGTAADIDDVPSGGSFTAEGIFRIDSYGEGSHAHFMDKGNSEATGWALYWSGTNLFAQINYDTTDATAAALSSFVSPDRVFHHIAITYDEGGDRKVYIWIDGINRSSSQIASVGSYVSEAADDLHIGAEDDGTDTFDGGVSWFRYSDVVRYTTTFTPPGVSAPPGVDGNTLRQYNFVDGAGTTLTDATGTANATITFGTGGKWVNSTDLATVEPGACVYNTGYTLGADGAGDGVVIRMATTADRDLVNQIALCSDESGRGEWQVEFYDVTGAASLMTLTSPRMHGSATGGTADTLIDATARWPQSMIGCTLYNITQGTSGAITAVSGDMTTLTVAGINGNAADVYYLHWSGGNWRHPWKELFVTYENTTSIDLRIKSVDGEGMLRLHRMGVQYSLFKNGDHESLTGANPDLITGWTNQDLDAGDTQSSAGGGAVIHAGAEAMQWNAGASNEGMYYDLSLASGLYYVLGGWSYGTGTVGMSIQPSGAHSLLQRSATDRTITMTTAAAWRLSQAVERNLTATPRIFLLASPGAAAARYTDDVFGFGMTAITLTVTPQSYANSLVGTGLLLNGRDLGPQAVVAGTVTASYADVRWSSAQRYSDPLAVSFATTPVLMLLYGDANNYARVYWSAANTLTVTINQGGVPSAANWATGGAFYVAGVSHQYRLLVTGSGAYLYVDGVLRATVAVAITWATVPTAIYWAADATGAMHADAVYAPY